MTNQLKPIQFQGEGKFTSDNCQIKSCFTIKRQFSHTILELQHIDFDDKCRQKRFWSLTGQLEDGRSISVDKLMVAKVPDGYRGDVEFLPMDKVVIGHLDSSPLLEVQYPLVGFYKGNFSIEDDEWTTIEIIQPEESASTTENQLKSWNVPLEGLTLKLSTSPKKFENYDKKAWEIMLLLSLATGNGVTSYRQIGNNGTLEKWEKWSGDEFGPGPIVHHFHMKQFLLEVFTKWKQWAPDKQKEIRIAVTYINLSATGYLDIGLFQIFQAWEFLAQSWMPEGELNDLEKSLKIKIKSVYREWKNENKNADPKGFLGSRVTSSFNWPKAKRQIESLAESRKLDLTKIGVDLEALKKARDSVAHTGKMENSPSRTEQNTFDLLAKARFGLQLLLLTELGYSGPILGLNNGLISSKKIDFFLR